MVARGTACTHGMLRRGAVRRARACAQVFDSTRGGLAKLAAIDTWLDGLGEKKREKEVKKHARTHHGQELRMPPLLPRLPPLPPLPPLAQLGLAAPKRRAPSPRR